MLDARFVCRVPVAEVASPAQLCVWHRSTHNVALPRTVGETSPPSSEAVRASVCRVLDILHGLLVSWIDSVNCGGLFGAEKQGLLTGAKGWHCLLTAGFSNVTIFEFLPVESFAQGRVGVVRVKTAVHDLCVITVYIPCRATKPDDTVFAAKMWRYFADIVAILPHRCTPVLFTDANAHAGIVGGELCSAYSGICTVSPDKEDFNGMHMRHLLSQHHLQACNTFARCGPTFLQTTENLHIALIMLCCLRQLESSNVKCGIQRVTLCSSSVFTDAENIGQLFVSLRQSSLSVTTTVCIGTMMQLMHVLCKVSNVALLQQRCSRTVESWTALMIYFSISDLVAIMTNSTGHFMTLLMISSGVKDVNTMNYLTP